MSGAPVSASTIGASEPVSPSTQHPPNSQDIAQAVLSSQADPIAGGSSNADMAKLTAALESGGGNFASPIQVSVVERQFSNKQCFLIVS
jgi:hypothetical protein